MKSDKNSQKENKKEEKKKCFIIMPVTTPDSYLEQYSGDKEHFIHVLNHLFIPAIEESKLQPIPPIAKGGEIIPGEIIGNLETADLVLCDMSTLNANVFFELGIRTSLNKPISLVRDDMTPKVPFDTHMINYHTYRSALSAWELPEDINSLSSHIDESIKTRKDKKSLWEYFSLSIKAEPVEEKKGVEGQLDSILYQIKMMRDNIEELRSKKIDLGERMMEQIIAIIDKAYEWGIRLRVLSVEPKERNLLVKSLIPLTNKGKLKLMNLAQERSINLKVID